MKEQTKSLWKDYIKKNCYVILINFYELQKDAYLIKGNLSLKSKEIKQAASVIKIISFHFVIKSILAVNFYFLLKNIDWENLKNSHMKNFDEALWERNTWYFTILLRCVWIATENNFLKTKTTGVIVAAHLYHHNYFATSP